jgi:hypothetical protein
MVLRATENNRERPAVMELSSSSSNVSFPYFPFRQKENTSKLEWLPTYIDCGLLGCGTIVMCVDMSFSEEPATQIFSAEFGLNK